MKRALLYGNGNFANLGCEAIARGTAEILGFGGEYSVSMATYTPELDKNIIDSLNCDTVKLNRGREGIDNIAFEVLRRMRMSRLASKIPNFNARKIAKGVDVAYAVGGDNYCYSGFERYFRMNKAVRKSARSNVFLGCSIEPSAINEEMIRDLDGYDVIFARETITYEALRKVCKTDVRLCADPAFMMSADFSEVPEELKDSSKKWIGVNLSPLIYEYSNNPDLVNEAVTGVLQNILDTTDYNLFFLPHVYGEGNDVFINGEIAKKLKCDGTRIFCYEKRINAATMKGIIASLNALICARTHASIAAYSSFVPTFVLGYSVKAKGIAKDIYGEYEGHIIPVQEIDDINSLSPKITAFVERIDEERVFLKKIIPEYSERAKVITEWYVNE